ncbi:MAG: FAD-binding oxidoreductase [Solirubrobacteraceae bacterium]|nr:FAD-binding oxidoreductase [Solirubrobacteraceae bacterium]
MFYLDTPSAAVRELRARVRGPVRDRHDDDYDSARQAWNLMVDQRPEAVVHAVDAEDVRITVDIARQAGLRVAPQGTGHNAGPLGDLSGTILLRTDAMRDVQLDVEGRTARVGAGTLWLDVTAPASEHGLAPLAGSSPDVGVTGYTLGGGMSWLGRQHGFAANSVLSMDVVTADGVARRISADADPDLFWAMRGGGGAFAVVTAMEFELFDARELSAGMLAFGIEQAREVLYRWRDWMLTAPDAFTTAARLMHLPALPDIPEPFRGADLVVVDGAALAAPDVVAHELRGLRELGPMVDTFEEVAPVALSRIHMDPEDPVPAEGDHSLVGEVDDSLLDGLLALAGGGPGSTGLLFTELRQLGGAFGVAPEGAGARDRFDGDGLAFAVGMTPDEESHAVVKRDLHTFRAMTYHRRSDHYMNFAEVAEDEPLHRNEVSTRLREIKAAVDPDDVIRSNHPV